MKRALLLSIILILTRSAFADWIFIPDTRYQQYHTYGLFIDNQSTLVLQNAGKAWGSVAAHIPLLEVSHYKGRPQLILYSSIDGAFIVNGRKDTLLTTTTDARLGLVVNWEGENDFKYSLGWEHQSGHISDNIEDTDLIGSNLGNEQVRFRLIKDFQQTYRLGGTLRPYVGSEPKLNIFAAEQFFEWWMGGVSQNIRVGTPYIALGLEEYGMNKIQLSGHIQSGYYWGNHIFDQHHTSIRTVIGYYDGIEPRMKYAQFKLKRSHFVYLGLMFDI